MENVAPGFRGHFIALLLQLRFRWSKGDQYTFMLKWLETIRNNKIFWVNNNRQYTIESMVYIAFNIRCWSRIIVLTNFLNWHPRYACPKVPSAGLLIGCGKKWEILRHFQGKLCGKKGLLCGKLCDFFKADLTLFF